MRKTAIAVAILALSGPAQAVDLACGAWLCGTVGFVVPGCSAVRVAMFKRVWHFPPRTPVPSWNKCTSGGSGVEFARPENFSVEEWQLATEMSESLSGMETPDVYTVSDPRASLIYEKTWDPVKGGRWVNIPNLSKPPRIIPVHMDNLTAADLAPLYEDGPPWVAVAKLRGVEISKNGEQYGPTHWMNTYGRNFYDNNDYNQDPITGEVELVSIQIDPASYLTPEQLAEQNEEAARQAELLLAIPDEELE